MRAKNLVKKILCMSFVYLVLIIMYLPVLVLIIYSFTGGKNIGVWEGFTFDLYFMVFADSEIIAAVGNTFLIAFISSLLATFIGAISAIGIFYMKRVAKSIMNGISQITVVNAEIVTGIAFMLFFLILFIPDGYVALIIAHTMIAIPYVILSVMPRLSQLNPNLYEAGLDLGASPMRSLFTVMMPQLVPGMLSGGILAFTLSLDDFVITSFINGDVDTISTFLYNKLTKKGVPPELRALSSLLFAVILIALIAINIYSKKRAKKARAL